MTWRINIGPQQLRLRAVVISPPGATYTAALATPSTCYACDARAIGTRDRRPEGGRVESACIRHADTFNGTKGAS